MPPATKTGTSVRCGRISCASTPVETGPIWPPASLPSMTIASAPMRTSLRAKPRAGAKAEDARAASLDALDRGAARQTAGQHDVADPMRRADIDQLEQLRVQGDQVDAERPSGQRRRSRRSRVESSSGDIDPEAMTPNPPAFEMAATRLRSDTQVIAPPMMARSQPRTSRPRAHNRSSSAPARSRSVSRSLAGRAFGRWKIRCADALGHPAASSP